jgi:hypothetical protein
MKLKKRQFLDVHSDAESLAAPRVGSVDTNMSHASTSENVVSKSLHKKTTLHQPSYYQVVSEE